MKKIVTGLLISMLVGFVHLVHAEPLVLEQAGNVLEEKTLEIGFADISYGHDLTVIENASGVEIMKNYNDTVVIPLYARYALNSKIEGILSLPYISNTNKTKITGSTTEVKKDTKGLGELSIGAKYFLREKDNCKLSAILSFDVPVGTVAFNQGFDIVPMIATTRKMKDFIVTANIKYGLTGEFDDASNIKQNPGDILGLGVGVEYPVSKYSLLGELIYESFGDMKTAGVKVADTAGSRMDLVLGARCNKGNLKFKIGAHLSLGKEDHRTYDYKVITGITYLLGK